jgi:hypothetical protein
VSLTTALRGGSESDPLEGSTRAASLEDEGVEGSGRAAER